MASLFARGRDRFEAGSTLAFGAGEAIADGPATRPAGVTRRVGGAPAGIMRRPGGALPGITQW